MASAMPAAEASAESKAEVEEDKVVTTLDEIEGFHIVKANRLKSELAAALAHHFTTEEADQ